MKEVKIETTVRIHDNWDAYDEATKSLFRHAQAASKKAYAPYSDFYVGASVALDNGTILEGCNQENAVYPLGLCAERVALFHAGVRFPDSKVVAIAVTIDYDRIDTESTAFPCGSCRQAMTEFEQRYEREMKIYIVGTNNKIIELANAGQLLPFAFDKSFLNGHE
ncbi:cytidine deaminase [Chitinophagales bacterium]|nr:cytidine deaminase [Chitinophagales bacterium]